jgi:hypothetical protein
MGAAHRITQFRIVELFEAEKWTVTPLAKPAHRQLSSAALQATCCIVGHLNSQGSSHTHKTDEVEPHTAAFSGAVSGSRQAQSLKEDQESLHFSESMASLSFKLGC